MLGSWQLRRANVWCVTFGYTGGCLADREGRGNSARCRRAQGPSRWPRSCEGAGVARRESSAPLGRRVLSNHPHPTPHALHLQVRSEVEAAGSRAAQTTAAAFDASIAELLRRKAAMLSHVAGAVASKTAELDSEARRFAAALEAGEAQSRQWRWPRRLSCAQHSRPPLSVTGVANGTREALGDDISPAQFAALYRALLGKADVAFSVANALPQVSGCAALPSQAPQGMSVSTAFL